MSDLEAPIFTDSYSDTVQYSFIVDSLSLVSVHLLQLGDTL